MNDTRTTIDLGETTPEMTSGVNSIADLWALAKITKDIKGDPVWDALHELGCNPAPIDDMGYKFDYSGYECLYIPPRHSDGIVRFALPKLAAASPDASQRVNTANSLITESRFAILGEDVWLIHEHYTLTHAHTLPIVEHILQNLITGADLFRRLP